MVEKKRKRATKTKEVILEEKKASEEVTDYEPSKVYEDGDKIFHKIWNDTGVVLETGETEDGIKKMVVEFEETGKRRLVMDVDTKAE
ncbi:hypothetical protein KAJ27_04310 [bacterium]|nr:hypothetical protein [bacterium]